MQGGGKKGGKWDNYNSIINKIYFLKIGIFEVYKEKGKLICMELGA